MKSSKLNGKLSRRKFLIVGAQGAAVAALASCASPTPTAAPKPAAPSATAAPAQPAAPKPAEPAKAATKVSFLAWGDNADVPAWEKITQLYKAKKPDVTLEVTPVADPGNNFYTKLQTSIAGGATPDVASFQGWEWQTYAAKGVLAEVADLVKRDKLDAFPDSGGVKLSTMYKDKLYMVPLQLASMVMFYAKKNFDEANMKYPTNDWTFDEFVEMAKKLTNTKTGQDKRFGIQANGGWFRDIHWIRGTGKVEFDNIVDPKKSQFNQPEIAAIIQKVASDWYNVDKIAPTAADSANGANQITTGNVAMKYEGPWWLPTMMSNKLQTEGKSVPFDVVLMPKQQDGSRPHRAWAEGFALMKGKNEAAAWDFMNFTAQPEGDKVYSEISGRMPNTFALIQDWWLPTVEKNFGLKNGKAFIEAFKAGQLDVVGLVPRSKIWTQVVKPLAYDKLIAGNAKASDVLSEVDKAVQKLLDEAK
jgi:multiple sugar transport system substrate-binding protein